MLLQQGATAMSSAQLNLSIDNDSISPSIEVGAFEALWSNRENNISSFKQLRERLNASDIDTTAHQAAIDNEGQTVAVLGTPLYMAYPRENTKLYNKIALEHLLISQVPIVSYETKDIRFNRIFFPERNKTMSALSEATIIVEAGETSGSLIQAKAALKQNRKVFILNNNFENPALSWPEKLLGAGAFRVHEIDDILIELQR